MSERVDLLAVLSQIRSSTTRDLPDKQLSEGEALTEFCTAFQKERCFSRHSCKAHFKQLLQVLKGHCLDNEWLEGVVIMETGHRILMTLRLLLRDELLQHSFMKGQSPIPSLAASLSRATHLHITMTTSDPISVDILKELTNIFQKISHSPRYHDDILSASVHVSLCALLMTSDLPTLHCTLCALTNISKQPGSCETLCATHALPPHTLLHIVSTYDMTSRRLATDLLLLLSQQPLFRTQLQNVDGLSILIRLFHSCSDAHVLHHAVCVVERLCEGSEGREAVRVGGGIPLLLNILSRNDITQSTDHESRDKGLVLQSAVCSVLTQLVLSDANAQCIVQLNGVYLVAMHILPLATPITGDKRLKFNLQKHALRALRYLFSMERHRSLFKKLFPTSLFELFIDIGHYTQDIGAYSHMVHAVNSLSEGDCDVIRGNIKATNQNKAPIFTIGGYAVLELLGSGAFGSVYKVHKPHSEGYLALKEIRCTHPCLGKTLGERSSAIGHLMTEVNMVREHLRHTNVVSYHKCFQEGGHLYIVMQYLEGASLLEHITSLKEKGQKFTEERLWRVFTQLTLALRYIHKEKRIVHRDLSPANLMLGEGDKLTITDFGLAKQKQRELSVLESVVGTMLYWCPELVHSEPYNEKADIWAAGCILYQMAALNPPFQASNMLALAKKIAEVDYPSIHDDSYSPLVSEVIQRCLTSDPKERADSVQLGGMLSGVLMSQLDQLSLNYEALERRLQREKQRSIKHINKAVWSEQRYQQLLSSTGGNYDNSQTNVRRRLSSSFAKIDAEAIKTGQTGLARYDREESPGDCEIDSLQKSTDSVFLEQPVAEATNSSPSNTKPSRINPLTSRVRSQSAIVGGTVGGDPLSLTSYPLGRLMSASGSPLATRQMNRTASVTSTLSISPRHVRQISDPVTALLTHLHKLLSLTLLPPPTPHTAARRLLLDKYKMSLFDISSDSSQLKTELHKLSTGSTEPVISLVDSGGPSRIVSRALSELCDACDGVEVCGWGGGPLTYEQLQAVIESLAQEYDIRTNTS